MNTDEHRELRGREVQMDRKTDGQTDGQRGLQTDGQADRPGELSGHLARPPVMTACVLRTNVRLQRKLVRSNTPSN